MSDERNRCMHIYVVVKPQVVEAKGLLGNRYELYVNFDTKKIKVADNLDSIEEFLYDADQEDARQEFTKFRRELNETTMSMILNGYKRAGDTTIVFNKTLTAHNGIKIMTLNTLCRQFRE